MGVLNYINFNKFSPENSEMFGNFCFLKPPEISQRTTHTTATDFVYWSFTWKYSGNAVWGNIFCKVQNTYETFYHRNFSIFCINNNRTNMKWYPNINFVRFTVYLSRSILKIYTKPRLRLPIAFKNSHPYFCCFIVSLHIFSQRIFFIVQIIFIFVIRVA